jgi:hypothetical protein
MSPQESQPDKIPIPQGRECLQRAGFDLGPNAGSRGECWIRRRDGLPVFVAYAPPWGEYFLAEAIHDVIALN